MVNIVLTILQQNDRFLLAQLSLTDRAGGTWIFPGGKIDSGDQTPIDAARRELKEEVGLEGKRFRKLFRMHSGKYRITIFFCDQWQGELKPACENIIGVGWFTWAEMYALGQSLAPFINTNLSYISYLIQHYNHHPNEWKEQWGEVDEND